MERQEQAAVKAARYVLRRTWFTWSVLPLAVFVLLVLLAGSASALATEPVGGKKVPDSFQAILAVCALVFLIAFSLDGHWTGAERVAKLLGGDPTDENALRRIRGTDSGQQTTQIMRNSAAALALMGHVIAAGALAALAARCGLAAAGLLLILAAEYHLFLLSRHKDYEQIIGAATNGDLFECIPRKKRERAVKASRKRDDNRH